MYSKGPFQVRAVQATTVTGFIQALKKQFADIDDNVAVQLDRVQMGFTTVGDRQQVWGYTIVLPGGQEGMKLRKQL